MIRDLPLSSGAWALVSQAVCAPEVLACESAEGSAVVGGQTACNPKAAHNYRSRDYAHLFRQRT